MTLIDELKTRKIWTLSDSEKRPLDLHSLATANAEVLHSKSSKLYTYEICKEVQEKHPETHLTIHVDSTRDDYILVDIEPEALEMESNPYVHLKMGYLEYSLGGGLHGIIQKRPSFLSDIFKDGDYETEIFSNGHFMIITENELSEAEKPQALYDIEQFKERFDEIRTKDIDTTRLESTGPVTDVKLHPLIQHELNKIPVKMFMTTVTDKSRNEFKYAMSIAGTLKNRYENIELETLIKYTYYLVNKHIDYRPKHDELRSVSMLDYPVTWLEYTVIQACNYVYDD